MDLKYSVVHLNTSYLSLVERLPNKVETWTDVNKECIAQGDGFASLEIYHQMREIIMVATVSFLLGGMLMFLMLQQSTPTSSHTNKTCNNNDKVVIDPLSISTATTAADKNDDSS